MIRRIKIRRAEGFQGCDLGVRGSTAMYIKGKPRQIHDDPDSLMTMMIPSGPNVVTLSGT